MSDDLNEPVVLFVGPYKQRNFDYWRLLLSEDEITVRYVPEIAFLPNVFLAYRDASIINVVTDISEFGKVGKMIDRAGIFVSNRFDFDLFDSKRNKMVKASSGFESF